MVSSLTELKERQCQMDVRLIQIEARMSSSRGESPPSDLPVSLPVKFVPELDALNAYLEPNEMKKNLVCLVVQYHIFHINFGATVKPSKTVHSLKICHKNS